MSDYELLRSAVTDLNQISAYLIENANEETADRIVDELLQSSNKLPETLDWVTVDQTSRGADITSLQQPHTLLCIGSMLSPSELLRSFMALEILRSSGAADSRFLRHCRP